MSKLMSSSIFLRRQQGLTLVELMIAITLGLILTAGMLQIFSGSRQTYRVEESLARLQENARFALEQMSNDIRMTSHWGCQSNPNNIINLLNTGGAGYIAYTVNPLTGLDGTAGASDSITLNGADGSLSMTLQPNLGTGYNPALNAALAVSTPHTFAVNTIALVSDCETGNIFQITGVSGGTISHAAGGSPPGNTVAAFTKAFRGDASLLPMRQILYWVAAGANGQRALWRSINGVNQELVSDVTDMQIIYGEDTNSDSSVDRYVPAGTAALNFNNVFGVRITLTMQTGEANTSTTAGARVTRVFSTTVSIRNRVL